MVNTFNQALTFSLKWEGSYSFDKDDPGGETKFGISKRAYPDIDIKSLTRTEAEVIYKRDYWDKANCESMEPKLAIAVFDSSVNCGVGRVRSWLSEKEEPDVRWFIQRRIQYYMELVKRKPALNKFIKGWLNRVNDLSKYVDIVTANS